MRTLRWLAAATMAVAAACQGKAPKPREWSAPSTGPQVQAPSLPRATSSTATAEVAIEAEPYALPAGHTLGDALPAVPPPAPRLGGGGTNGGAVLQAKTGCASDAPDDYALARRVELTYPPAKAGDPAQVVEVCLLQRTVERADKVAESGKAFLVVAAFADDTRVSHAFDPLTRQPTTLPPERRRAGHDAGAWAGLFATGDPERPALAVVSARFYDGALGEEVQFARASRLLRNTAHGWQWSPFANRAHASMDVEHLRALCAGKADASPADKAAGPLAVACERADAAEVELAKAEARLATRKRRIAGGSGGQAASDADPQSIWLRDARAALSKGDYAVAIDTALQVDVVCGEAVAEAHAVVRDALTAQHLEPLRTQPQQSLSVLCEPLPDKPVPRRPREAAIKGKPENGTERPP